MKYIRTNKAIIGYDKEIEMKRRFKTARNYIRVKNGIVYVGDLFKDEQGNYCKSQNHNIVEVSAEYIIKEADTIEELCDDFVVDSKINNSHYIIDSFDLYADLQENRFYPTDVIYGAIWTDKGLIYVAKMNDEGEWELC